MLKKFINNRVSWKRVLSLLIMLLSIFILSLLIISFSIDKSILISFMNFNIRGLDLVYFLFIIVFYLIFKIIKVLQKKYYQGFFKVVLIFSKIILILFFLLSSFIYIIKRSSSVYYTFKSPDKKHTIIAKETSILLLGEVSLYERENPFFIKNLDAYILPDDGYTPIYNNNYNIKWNENKFSLSVYDASGSKDWFSVSVNLENKDVSYKHSRSDEINVTKQDKENIEDNIKDKDSFNRQNILNNLSIKDSIKINDSPYGIIMVDKAGPRNLWYFIEFKDDRMIYISDLPDNSPIVNGSFDLYGNINLKFEDINQNINRYISKDGGKTWSKN